MRFGRSEQAERRTRGCHCGRKDREPAAVGFRSVPLGGSGGSVFAVGRGEWRSSQAGGAGAAGELIIRTSRFGDEDDRPDIAAVAEVFHRSLDPSPRHKLGPCNPEDVVGKATV